MRLVHMNGRIYDPLIGRFLSADTVLSDPANLQCYNRYTYVRNNPLTLVDPTGHLEVSMTEEERKKLKDAADEINKIVNARIQPILNDVKSGKITADQGLVQLRDALCKPWDFGGNNIKVSVEVKALGAEFVLKGKTGGTKYEGGIPDQGLAGIGAKLLDRVTTNAKGESVYKDEASIADGLNVDGHAIGTDKIDHMFFDGSRLHGKKEADARKQSEQEEEGVNGLQSSGVYSNADIEANMAGRQFYTDVYNAFRNKTDYSFDVRSFNLEKMDENKNPNRYSPEMEKRVRENEARLNPPTTAPSN